MRQIRFLFIAYGIRLWMIQIISITHVGPLQRVCIIGGSDMDGISLIAYFVIWISSEQYSHQYYCAMRTSCPCHPPKTMLKNSRNSSSHRLASLPHSQADRMDRSKTAVCLHWTLDPSLNARELDKLRSEAKLKMIFRITDRLPTMATMASELPNSHGEERSCFCPWRGQHVCLGRATP